MIRPCREKEENEMTLARKLCAALCGAVEKINAGAEKLFAGKDRLASDTRAEAYIGEAVKILIAVVIGALLLTLAYALMKDTVFPSVAEKIQDLFTYSA